MPGKEILQYFSQRLRGMPSCVRQQSHGAAGVSKMYSKISINLLSYALMFENTTKSNALKCLIIAVAILLFGVCDCINMYKIPSIYETIYTRLEIEPILAS